MVADDNNIQIFGYTPENHQPYHIVTYYINQSNLDNFRPDFRTNPAEAQENSKAEEENKRMPNHQALIDSGKPTTPTKSQYKGEVSSYYKTRDGIDGKY